MCGSFHFEWHPFAVLLLFMMIMDFILQYVEFVACLCVYCLCFGKWYFTMSSMCTVCGVNGTHANSEFLCIGLQDVQGKFPTLFVCLELCNVRVCCNARQSLCYTLEFM